MKRADLVPSGYAVVGCYSVDVYCEHPNHVGDYFARSEHIGGPGDVPDLPQTATGETRTECLRSLRRSGWWISRDFQTALCPYHAKQVPR